ncbi:MAG: hypothetical protein WDZ59_07580 [Pirellulales bacterium]
MATIAKPDSREGSSLRRHTGRLSRRLWHTSAPQQVSACRAGESGPGWDAWIAHLAARKSPAPLEGLLPGRTSPLLWNLPEVEGELAGDPLVAALLASGKRKRPERTLAEQLAPWSLESASAPPTLELAVQMLAVCHALPRLAGPVSPELWWELLDVLLQIAEDAAAVDLAADPLIAQLWGGELPWTLGYLFPEINACRKAAAEGRRRLSEGLIELTDGEGLIEARHLERLRPLMACWTRCRAMAEAASSSCYTQVAESQFEWAVTQMLRLARADGSQLLSGDAAGAWNAALFEAALRYGGSAADRTAARESLPRSFARSIKGKASRELPDPAVESEWSAAAVLRPDWSAGASRLAVNYGDARLLLELECGGETVLAGEWGIDLAIGGRRFEPVNSWEQLCWVSDEEVDYLELEIDLGDAARVQRQLLLAREDGLLYLADNIRVEPSASEIEYTGTLPLGPTVEWRPEEDTREGYLSGRQPRALVMPLALPEWRTDPRGGTLGVEDGRLRLHQHLTGQNLSAPLLFDLNRRRSARQRTWRQLTVAESLEVVSRDTAVGYRAQCGSDQWLIYRAMSGLGNRTVLGQNLATEFLFGRFSTSGDVEELIEIE